MRIALVGACLFILLHAALVWRYVPKAEASFQAFWAHGFTLLGVIGGLLLLTLAALRAW